MPSPMLSPAEADLSQQDALDSPRPLSAGDDLRQNLAQLTLGGKECLRMKRLLGGAGAGEFETYSLPVSRLPSMHDDSNETSYSATPVETPGTSRVPTRDSQYSMATKSRSPLQIVLPTAPTSHPSSHVSQGPPDERPHQVKFVISDSPDGSPPPTPASPGPPTPVPNPNDPYRRSRRKPQSTNPAEIPDRFHFEKVTKKRQNQQLHALDQPGAGSHSTHHHGGLLHKLSSKSHKDHLKQSGYESSGDEFHDEHSGSQVSLRRFFRGGGIQKKSSRPSTPTTPTADIRRPASPAPKKKDKKHVHASTMPFGDDHAGLGLTEKYGKFGKVLGAGAGGSVRLMKRASDGTTFAVKEFRARGEHESQREYSKKVNAEFTIGSILSHQNIVETLDIVNEGGRYFEVMEYCRYDLIVAGTRYLHEMGLAHRDLKLDNCVVNEFGIVKIIDFGCAVVFKYPFEQDIIEATGIVGSDPYLAPEVCTEIRYDPQPADMWSLAIIYCCMVMRRFPWKSPRISDPSFKNFASAPNPYAASSSTSSESSSNAVSRKSTLDSSSTLAASDSHNMATTLSGTPLKKEPTPTPAPPPINKGPMRLLNRLNPPPSRPIIGRMLDLQPKTRAKMDEVWADPWFLSLKRCEMVEERTLEGAKRMVVKRTGTHTHILVGPSGDDVTPSGTSIKRVSNKSLR